MTTLNYWNQHHALMSPARRPRTLINWGLIAAVGLDMAVWAALLKTAI